jgi:hypothetical protein
MMISPRKKYEKKNLEAIWSYLWSKSTKSGCSRLLRPKFGWVEGGLCTCKHSDTQVSRDRVNVFRENENVPDSLCEGCLYSSQC